MIRIILFLAQKCLQNNSARVCKCAVYHWFNKTPKRDMASFDLIYWTLGTGSKFVGHSCMFVCMFACLFVCLFVCGCSGGQLVARRSLTNATQV